MGLAERQQLWLRANKRLSRAKARTAQWASSPEAASWEKPKGGSSSFVLEC